MKIGIIGLGYVGGAVQNWFERPAQKRRYQLFLYDKFKNIGSIEEVNRADIIFVAVPTPFIPGKGYDDSAVRESVANIRDGKIIVLKSTIMPRSTEKFQKRYPRKTILFNPEFLRAATSKQDFLEPERQIVGYVPAANGKGASGSAVSAKRKAAAKKVLATLPSAPYTAIMQATEAELVKYFGNSFLAARVIFANQFFDICRAAGVDYATVKNAAARDSRIGSSHFDVFDSGYRGYGGPCLPKDVRALMQFARSIGVETDLLAEMEKINKKLGQK